MNLQDAIAEFFRTRDEEAFHKRIPDVRLLDAGAAVGVWVGAVYLTFHDGTEPETDELYRSENVIRLDRQWKHVKEDRRLDGYVQFIISKPFNGNLYPEAEAARVSLKVLRPLYEHAV